MKTRCGDNAHAAVCVTAGPQERGATRIEPQFFPRGRARSRGVRGKRKMAREASRQVPRLCPRGERYDASRETPLRRSAHQGRGREMGGDGEGPPSTPGVTCSRVILTGRGGRREQLGARVLGRGKGTARAPPMGVYGASGRYLPPGRVKEGEARRDHRLIMDAPSPSPRNPTPVDIMSSCGGGVHPPDGGIFAANASPPSLWRKRASPASCKRGFPPRNTFDGKGRGCVTRRRNRRWALRKSQGRG